MIKEDAEATSAPWPERPNDFLQVVCAIEKFDNDTFDSEVIAPHLFHEFRVVYAFNKQATGSCHASRRRRHRNGTRSSARCRCGARRFGSSQGDLSTLYVERAISQSNLVIASLTISECDER
jgi:hypothetical protein